MINREKIKQETCQPPTPFYKDLPLYHTSTPFFSFSESPPLGEVIKIYSTPPLFKKWGEGGGSKLCGSVTHNNTQVPNTMLSFRKKLMSQSQENFRTEGQKDRRTDRFYFIGPFWPQPEVQKKECVYHRQLHSAKRRKQNWNESINLIVWSYYPILISGMYILLHNFHR